jgi:hypothetical protein
MFDQNIFANGKFILYFFLANVLKQKGLLNSFAREIRAGFEGNTAKDISIEVLLIYFFIDTLFYIFICIIIVIIFR